jgi:hypothetical protein
VDVYSLGRVIFVALLGTVTLEVALVARYWTWAFAVATFLSYFMVYPYMIIFPYVELAVGYYDPANVGVSEEVLSSPAFWLVIMVCYLLCFGMRFAERTWVWVFRPHDSMILAEREKEGQLMAGLSAPTRRRLLELGLARTRRKGDPESGATAEGFTSPDLISPGSSEWGGSPGGSPRRVAAAARAGGGEGDGDGGSATQSPDNLAGWNKLQPRPPRQRKVNFAQHVRGLSLDGVRGLTSVGH